jgi:hypothetical protein
LPWQTGDSPENGDGSGLRMTLYRLLVPRHSRSFVGKRWCFIVLRTLHLVGVAGLVGGLLYQVPAEAWMPYLTLTLASGAVYFAIELWSTGIFLIQLRGLSVLVKLAILGLVPALPGLEAYLLFSVIVISGIFSHAPGNVRYYSLFHRRRIDEL